MAVKFEERDGAQVAVLSKDEYDTLLKNFDKGYGKGTAAGRKAAVDALGDLLDGTAFIDSGNAADLKGLDAIKTTLSGVKEGKFVPADKVNDKDGVIADLQTKLDEKKTAYEKLEASHQTFRQSTLIDGKLSALAAGKKAFDAPGEVLIFKNRYQVGLDDENRVTVKNADGQPIFNPKTGDALGLDSVFDEFYNSRKAYYEGNAGGGSGDKGDGDGDAKSVASMSEEEFQKTVSDVKLGKKVSFE